MTRKRPKPARRNWARIRLADFAKHAAGHPAMLVVPGIGRAVLIHPLADETALLRRLGLSPERCTKVDLYWEHRGDVRFVEIESTAYANNPLGAVTGRQVARNRSITASVIHVVVPDVTITLACVVSALRRFAEDGLPPRARPTRGPKNPGTAR